MMRVALFGLLLAAGPVQSDDPKLEWKIGANQVAEYKVKDARSRRASEKTFYVFGVELNKDGTNQILIDSYRMIPMYFFFTLNSDIPAKRGKRWEVEVDFFRDVAALPSSSLPSSPSWSWQGSGLKPVRAKGIYSVKKVTKKNGQKTQVLIAGSFTFYELRSSYVNRQRRIT